MRLRRRIAATVLRPRRGSRKRRRPRETRTRRPRGCRRRRAICGLRRVSRARRRRTWTKRWRFPGWRWAAWRGFARPRPCCGGAERSLHCTGETQRGQRTIGDPFFWYFSASLAMREGDRAARSAIEHALKLAPNDPAILFEAGHVADYSGDDDRRGAIGSGRRRAIPMAPLARLPPRPSRCSE